MFQTLIATVVLTLTPITGFVEWDGIDPYPGADWSNTVIELKPAVEEFEKKWGESLYIRQVYRPSEYTRHLRSVWEIWRWMRGMTYTEGYRCEEYEHINPEEIGKLSYLQRRFIEIEAKRHAFWDGGTPPACYSDHSLGIAVDITPPSDWSRYKEWIEVGVSVGLCHYIAGDEPHFGVAKYLPEDIDCSVP
ncbi:MAG: hypothetical protein WCX79_01740 [Candidatus Paceibacterota bacterium]|jgi:hypothetical protein